jgi:hypothetical protein
VEGLTKRYGDLIAFSTTPTAGMDPVPSLLHPTISAIRVRRCSIATFMRCYRGSFHPAINIVKMWLAQLCGTKIYKKKMKQ